MITKTQTNMAECDVINPTDPSFVTWDEFSKSLTLRSEQGALEHLVHLALKASFPYIISKKYENFEDQDPSVVLQLFGLSPDDCQKLANTIPPAWVKITTRPDQHGNHNVWLLSRKRLMKLLASEGGIDDE